MFNLLNCSLQLWGIATNSNIEILQTFQSKVRMQIRPGLYQMTIGGFTYLVPVS